MTVRTALSRYNLLSFITEKKNLSFLTVTSAYWGKTNPNSLKCHWFLLNMLLENLGLVHSATFNGSRRDPGHAKKRWSLFSPRRERQDKFTASDTNQFSIQMLLTMIVQFAISVESMKSNNVPFNVCKPPSCNFHPVVFS